MNLRLVKYVRDYKFFNVILQDVCLRQELLEYMCVYVNDASKSLKPSWGNVYIRELVDFDVTRDLNVTLKPSEHSTSGSNMTSDMKDFQEYVNHIEAEDINSSGLFFTWTKNLHKAKVGAHTEILKKLDRIIGNEDFINRFSQAYAFFLPYMISHHGPTILILPKCVQAKKKPFKFASFITDKEDIQPLVSKIWEGEEKGCRMFKTVKKLRGLKKHLKKLAWKNGDVFENVKRLREAGITDEEVKHAMFQIDDNKAPGPDGYSASFFKKAWSIVGKDVCLAVKEFFDTGKILRKINSTLIALVPKILTPMKVSDFRPIAFCNVIYKYISKILTDRIKRCLGKLVSKNQSDFIPNRHIQDNILLARELFKGYNRKMDPKRVALKVDIQKGYDTVNWKFLEDILKGFCYPTNLKVMMLLLNLLSIFKSSWGKGITDEEVKHAMFQIDDNKAPGPDASFFKKSWSIVGKDVCLAVKEFFDTGKILRKINSTLIALVPKILTPMKVSDFRPIAFCNVIYKCISKILTDKIKRCLDKLVSKNQSAFIPNRHIQDNILLVHELFKGYFKGGRGLRQCDPMSPYLFTLVMEILTLIIRRKVDQNHKFQYHFGCKKLKITTVCFADDLLIFCHADKDSVSVLKQSIEEFEKVAGLIQNYNKSTIIFGCLNEEEQEDILDIFPFKVEKRPIKYLGRLLLVAFVVESIHVYWASVFLLPVGVIKDINKLLKNFLWNQSDGSRGKAKVAWKSVCKSKQLGGLGLKDLGVWNKEMIVKHLWNIFTDKESLWVKWIHTEKLKGRNFWEMEEDKNDSWG
ncbi:RNA-directed DNA polymerase, eukaryota, reverse transcriptase zinc-binding domain protein [Tanacetum coccineum]